MPRHKSTELPSVGRPVRIEINGRTYEGTYTVAGPIVTVESLMLGTKSAKRSDVPADALAKIMLTELVFEDQDRQRP